MGELDAVEGRPWGFGAGGEITASSVVEFEPFDVGDAGFETGEEHMGGVEAGDGGRDAAGEFAVGVGFGEEDGDGVAVDGAVLGELSADGCDQSGQVDLGRVEELGGGDVVVGAGIVVLDDKVEGSTGADGGECGGVPGGIDGVDGGCAENKADLDGGVYGAHGLEVGDGIGAVGGGGEGGNACAAVVGTAITGGIDVGRVKVGLYAAAGVAVVVDLVA